jgi:hypothetical protein
MLLKRPEGGYVRITLRRPAAVENVPKAAMPSGGRNKSSPFRHDSYVTPLPELREALFRHYRL